MKRTLVFLSLAFLLAGCAWWKSGKGTGGEVGSPVAGADQGRGTTGVSSGSDFGPKISGSDVAPR